MYHTIIIVGNLGPRSRNALYPSGQAVTNFSVAVNDNYTASNGEKVERTIWIRVSTWGKQAEVCNQYLRKGRKVLVEGRLVPQFKHRRTAHLKSPGWHPGCILRSLRPRPCVSCPAAAMRTVNSTRVKLEPRGSRAMITFRSKL